MDDPCPTLPQMFVCHHHGEFSPVRDDKLDLAALTNALDVVRLVEHAASEHLALHTHNRDPHGLWRVGREARPAVVDDHLEVVRIVWMKPLPQLRVCSPLAAHLCTLRRQTTM